MFLNNLPYELAYKGMLTIFLAIGIIYLAIHLLLRFTKDKK